MLGLQRDLQPTQSVVHRHLISLTPNQVANSLVRNSSPRKNKSLNKKDHKIPQANKNTPTHKLMFDEEDITNQKGEGIHQKKKIVLEFGNKNILHPYLTPLTEIKTRCTKG